jgi:hypothetical protein
MDCGYWLLRNAHRFGAEQTRCLPLWIALGFLNDTSQPRIIASIAVAVGSDGHAGVMKGRDGFYECSACELIDVSLAVVIAAVVAIWALGLLSLAFSLPSDFWEGDPQGSDAKAKPPIRS